MAKQLTADDNFILKQQARRRLIGAVALTTAVVIILPLVFDSEPPAATLSNIELRISDSSKVEEIHSIAAEPEVVAPSSEAAQVSTSEVSRQVRKAEVVSVPAKAAVMPKTEPQPKVASQPQAVPQPKAEAKPKVAPKPKAAARPKAEPKKVSKPAAHVYPRIGFVVQVAALSNAASAKTMQDKLSKQGLHAYTEKVGRNIRVRVGSYPTRKVAESVRHKLEEQGFHPNVISLVE